jgi:hypothetical protein
MPLDLTDRRASDKLTEAIDNALDLAEECGWRYALAFLISEEVPAEIIQRLLSGGGRARELPKGRSASVRLERTQYRSNGKAVRVAERTRICRTMPGKPSAASVALQPACHQL